MIVLMGYDSNYSFQLSFIICLFMHLYSSKAAQTKEMHIAMIDMFDALDLKPQAEQQIIQGKQYQLIYDPLWLLIEIYLFISSFSNSSHVLTIL